MANVHETIPEDLRDEVEASRAWFTEREGIPFEVTGILDPERALSEPGAKELRLVLCGGDRCEQRSFRVTTTEGGVDVALVGDETEQAPGAPQAELDPPPGARRGWLDAALSRHAFVVLVFYRGFW